MSLDLYLYWVYWPFTARKMKFSIKDFFCKCDQICSFLWIWSHLLQKSLMENFIFCAVIRIKKILPVNNNSHFALIVIKSEVTIYLRSFFYFFLIWSIFSFMTRYFYSRLDISCLFGMSEFRRAYSNYTSKEIKKS